MAKYHRCSSVPPHPKIKKRIQATKNLIKSGADLNQLRGDKYVDLSTYLRLIQRPARSRAHTLVSPTRQFAPKVGTVRALVLLVDFSDNQATQSSNHYDELLFSRSTLSSGSMRDFYLETSYGQLDVIGDVFGWYRAPRPYSFYTDGQYGFGNYPNNVEKLTEDVVQLAKADVDFSNYDLDGDGYVDALFIVHSGSGAEATLNANQIWSHRSQVFPIQANGVYVRDYTMEPEDGRIGVFAHEFGHNLGLPDLYDTNYDSSGVGDWCLMAGGSWNNDGQTPAHMSPWCKYKLGWIDPTVLFGDERSVSLNSSAVTKDIFKLPVSELDSQEYFLVENRRKQGFDMHIPGEGLLVWHIDERQINNDNQNHYLVALEQADGLLELEKGLDEGDMNDPFPGTVGKRIFNAETVPNSFSYDGFDSNVSITNISDPGESMTTTITVGKLPAGRTLGERPTEDVYGVSSASASLISTIGVSNIAQLANVDVDDAAQNTGIDLTKFYVFVARAHLIANFSLDSRKVPVITDLTLNEILSESNENLLQGTSLSNADIDAMKLRLASLATAIDGRVFNKLTMPDVMRS